MREKRLSVRALFKCLHRDLMIIFSMVAVLLDCVQNLIFNRRFWLTNYILFTFFSYCFLGFNPIHLVVRQSDVVHAEPTGGLSDTKPPLESEIETTPIPNALNDSVNSPEDGMSNLHDEETFDVSDRESWTEGEDAILSKDVGIQCELIDVVAMLAEYKKSEKQGQ